MNQDQFVGRNGEARAILRNTESKHSSLIIAEAGMGKTALLEFLIPVLTTEGKLISTQRVGPGFGAWLKEVFTGLYEQDCLPYKTKDFEADLKSFQAKYKTNDERANVLSSICASHKVILMIDDASGVSAGSRPWLIKFVESCTVIAAIDPKALKKSGTKRFWKLFDEVKLAPLSRTESAELLDKLIQRFGITADDLEIYKRSVLDLAQGSPFELQRLVKYHSSETLVKSREINSGSHSFVDRDVKQIALAPILLIFSAFTIAGRYISRVQGDMDFYVLSAIGLGLLIVITPLLRTALKPRSK